MRTTDGNHLGTAVAVTPSDQKVALLDDSSTLREVVAGNPIMQRALRRLKESHEQENHMAHHTKHSSHSTHSKGHW